MEYPGEWDLLTASLAVSSLKEPFETWAFLVLQGLVRDELGNRKTFVELAEAATGREPIPGPSNALQIASGLMERGIATERAATPDPFGKIAEKRHGQVESWKHASPSGQSQDLSRWKFWRR